MTYTIAYVKLITGEDIICKLNNEEFDETATNVQIIHPYVVNLDVAEDGEYDCRAKRWALFLDKEKYNHVFWIPKTLIMLSGKADTNIAELYEGWVETDADENDLEPEEIQTVYVTPSGTIH